MIPNSYSYPYLKPTGSPLIKKSPWLSRIQDWFFGYWLTEIQGHAYKKIGKKDVECFLVWAKLLYCNWSQVLNWWLWAFEVFDMIVNMGWRLGRTVSRALSINDSARDRDEHRRLGGSPEWAPGMAPVSSDCEQDDAREENRRER